MWLNGFVPRQVKQVLEKAMRQESLGVSVLWDVLAIISGWVLQVCCFMSVSSVPQSMSQYVIPPEPESASDFHPALLLPCVGDAFA